MIVIPGMITWSRTDRAFFLILSSTENLQQYFLFYVGTGEFYGLEGIKTNKLHIDELVIVE